MPIVGFRYTKTGKSYDLCSKCFEKQPAEEKAKFEAIEKPKGSLLVASCKAALGCGEAPPAAVFKALFRTIDEADERMLDIGDGLSLWYRTWGNPRGTPVLFVHGGPGNCVADYNDVNARFFEAERFFVVEVDQRGTGRSQPSVRDGHAHMQRYLDISIAQMSADFETVRASLGIERWLVFGGSWGSTLGIDYAERYASRCLGLIARGIYLNTRAEFDAIYARNSFDDNARRLAEFDTFLELASAEAARQGQPPLTDWPADAERFIRLYEAMHLRGDAAAIWRFYVFENNLMEEDPADLLDPHTVPSDPAHKDHGLYREALSVSFFEARLFLQGTFEEPGGLDLLGRLGALAAVPMTWVVQGTGDEVCPEVFAQQLVAGLEAAGVPHKAHFVDAGHKSGSDGMSAALRGCVDDFVLMLQQYI
jgi:proline iminopeptidase